MKGTCLNCSSEYSYYPNQHRGKFCSNKCQGEFQIKQRFVEGSEWRQNMGTYLKKIRGEKCEECGIIEWNGKPLTFQVDHIDGNRRNNRFDNLKIVCPNCHTQCPTWGIGNMSDDGRKRLLEGSLKGNKITNKKVD